jgi:hypothetical protein
VIRWKVPGPQGGQRRRTGSCAAARGGMISSVSVRGSYLAGSHNLVMRGSNAELWRVVVRCRCCHFCCHRSCRGSGVGPHRFACRCPLGRPSQGKGRAGVSVHERVDNPVQHPAGYRCPGSQSTIAGLRMIDDSHHCFNYPSGQLHARFKVVVDPALWDSDGWELRMKCVRFLDVGRVHS